MKAIISVIGLDKPGILALISNCCFQAHVSVEDITQTIMDGFFVMVMQVNVDNINCGFDEFVRRAQELGKKENLRINVMNREIFDAMHTV